MSVISEGRRIMRYGKMKCETVQVSGENEKAVRLAFVSDFQDRKIPKTWKYTPTTLTLTRYGRVCEVWLNRKREHRLGSWTRNGTRAAKMVF